MSSEFKTVGRGPAILFRVGLYASLMIILIRALSFLHPSIIWDDAYMFVRYADNLLDSGSVSWNPGGPPTYGLTSMLYLVAVIPMRLLNPDNPSLAALFASFFDGAAFLALLIFLLYFFTDHRSPLGLITILLPLVIMARVSFLSFHLISGMDTTFALAYLTLFLIVCKWSERSASYSVAALMGVLGGLMFYVRPDLCLFSTLIPASMFALNPDRGPRRRAALVLALTLIIFAGLIFFSARYFHSPLPLPFYCKGVSVYGPEMVARYAGVPIKQLLYFLGSYWPFVLVIGAAIAWDPRSWLRKESSLDTGMLAATICFLLYYAFFVMQIMYYDQRFDYPTLPAILYLAARSVPRIVAAFEARGITVSRVPDRAWAYVLAILIASLYSPAVHGYYNFREMRELVKMSTISPWIEYKLSRNMAWYELDHISALPDDLVIAATEVGHLAAYNPRKQIIDLTGLNDTEIAHHGFDPEKILTEQRPDFIYMPHFHYVQMNRRLEASPTFQRDYHFIPRDEIKKEWGVAIRKDSKYADRLEQIIAAGLNRPRRPGTRRSYFIMDEGF
jgi:hypothetical protein